jgi:hypothetical protein
VQLGIAVISPPQMPTAPQSSTVKATFEKHGLLGTFAVDCRRLANPENLYQVVRALDDNRVQREQMSSVTKRDFAFIADRIAESKPNLVSIGGTIDNHRLTIAVRVEAGRMRVMESTREPNERLVADGRFTNSGTETPWFSKCP